MNHSNSGKTSHRWRFFRAGGFDQVRLDRGADLVNLGSLDPKLWVALSCPSQGLEFDAKTLRLIDSDGDGRVRIPEILGAVQWACRMVKNPDTLVPGSPQLALSAINDADAEGAQLLASARQILTNLGKSGADAITLEDTNDTAKIFVTTKFNGDGIVPVDSAEDEKTQAVIKDIMVCLGETPDRSGKPGVSQAKVDQFFAEAQAYADWWKASESDAKNIVPLGAATGAAQSALAAVRAKIDDFFARCRLAAFDGRAVEGLNRSKDEYIALGLRQLSASGSEVADFPLASVDAGKALPLAQGLNPGWTDAMAVFRAATVKPILGDKDSLTEADWANLKAKFAPYEAWTSKKAGASVEKLGLKRVQEILAGTSAATLQDLIAKDKALEPEVTAMSSVERLIRYNQFLVKLLNNFVNFRDFYSRQDKAVFQAGTLYLDQRSCELCLRVEDMGRHGTFGILAGTYLVYVDCVRKKDGAKLNICAAFTAGDSDNLMVGRNGVFYDREGRDYDATIVKIVDNPISIRQAFWSPYKKFIRMIEAQVAKRAAAADAASTSKLESAATAVATVDKTPPKPKFDVGTVAALGVAVGGIAAAFSGLLNSFFGLGPWMPAGILGLVALISGPSMLIAALKLRKRNLGPLLDANGWAINSQAKINIPFGGSLTDQAALPPGAERAMTDPYAEARTPWKRYVFLVLFIAATGYFWKTGQITKWIDQIKGKDATAVSSGTNTPTASPAPEAAK